MTLEALRFCSLTSFLVDLAFIVLHGDHRGARSPSIDGGGRRPVLCAGTSSFDAPASCRGVLRYRGVMHGVAPRALS